MRIAVYAPALNEESNVQGWYESAKDADEIVLTDMGSDDETTFKAATCGGRITVRHARISPWRFDTGFNVALSQVSEDVDVAVPLHLDERLQPGWREELLKAWSMGGRQFIFNYQWTPEVSYRHDRIHARHGFRWRLPAHEYLVGPGPKVDTDLTIVHNHSDRDRTGDSSLIELAWRENPDLPRAQYYWGRELYYLGRWVKARQMLTRYLNNPASVYGAERAKACEHMADMVWPEQREVWLARAKTEAGSA